MRVKTLGPGAPFRVEVDELSGLAGRGQEVTTSGLLAVGDELTAVFAMSRHGREPELRPDAWDTGYEAPRKSGSNFEGIAADASGTIVAVTEVPAGLVVVELSA